LPAPLPTPPACRPAGPVVDVLVRGLVVQPLAVLVQVLEGEALRDGKGDADALVPVAAWLERVDEGVPLVEVADHRPLAGRRVLRKDEVDLDLLAAIHRSLLDH